jgi:hypothetical protein
VGSLRVFRDNRLDVIIEGYSVVLSKIRKSESYGQGCNVKHHPSIMKIASSETHNIHVKIVKWNFNLGINSVQTLQISSADSDLLAFRPSM